jgi:hypothetical protein
MNTFPIQCKPYSRPVALPLGVVGLSPVMGSPHARRNLQLDHEPQGRARSLLRAAVVPGPRHRRRTCALPPGSPRGLCDACSHGVAVLFGPMLWARDRQPAFRPRPSFPGTGCMREGSAGCVRFTRHARPASAPLVRESAQGQGWQQLCLDLPGAGSELAARAPHTRMRPYTRNRCPKAGPVPKCHLRIHYVKAPGFTVRLNAQLSRALPCSRMPKSEDRRFLK